MASATDPPVSLSSRLRAHGRAGIFVLGAIVLAFVLGGGALAGWFGPSPPADNLLVSGDIEAHESLLSFKTVQSRIVLLPFDEGATVKQGTILARADDADYQQQVVIARAALEVQSRQLASIQQSVAAARQTVADDYADLAEKTVDAGRQQSLWQKEATSMQARDLAVTAQKQSAAALARDQALEKVAERNVDLAVAEHRQRPDRADDGQNRARLYRAARALHRRHLGAPGRTGRKRCSRHAGRDPG